MTMEIEEAAKKYATQSQYKSDFPHDMNSVEDGFLEGAYWSLDHQWHDAKKEFPTDGLIVIAYSEEIGNYLIMCYCNKAWYKVIETKHKRLRYYKFKKSVDIWMYPPRNL